MTTAPLGIGSEATAHPGHLCLFHASISELRACQRDFMRLAIDDPRQGALLFGAPGIVQQLFDDLETDLGHRLDDEQRRGRVEVIESDPDPDVCLERLLDGYDSLARRGYERIRSFARATWGIPGFPAPEDQLWLDSRLNHLLAGRNAILICAYDLTALPGMALAYGGLESHPQIVIGDRVLPSPAYLEPARYVTERLVRLPWLTEA